MQCECDDVSGGREYSGCSASVEGGLTAKKNSFQVPVGLTVSQGLGLTVSI